MNKKTKIALLGIPVITLSVMLLILFQFESSVSLPFENELDKISIETSKTVLSNLNSPLIGSYDAPVTIIAFNNYQCMECKSWYEKSYPEISENLIETKKANVIFVDSILLDDNSILISEATFCANDQEMYSQYQKKLFQSQDQINDSVKSKQLKKLAIELDLDLELFEECLDSGKYKQNVLSNIEYAKNFGVEKIPLFKIINFEGKEHVLKGGLSNSIFETTVNRFQ